MKISIKIQFLIASVFIVLLLFYLYLGVDSLLTDVNSAISSNTQNNIKTIIENFESNFLVWLIITIIISGLIGLFITNILLTKLTNVRTELKKIANLDFSIGTFNYKIHDELSSISTDLEKVQRVFGRFVRNTNLVVDVFFKLRSEKSIEGILDRLADLSQELFDVKYVAISVFDKSNKVKNFIHRGINKDVEKMIGKYPEGKGLLGYLHEEKKTLMTEDIAKHPKSSGFPSNHPQMKTLLATPLIHDQKSYGNLYISEKNDGMPFNEDDKKFLEMIGTIAVNSIITFEFIEYIAQRNDMLKKESDKIKSIMLDLSDRDFLIDFNFQLEDENNKLILDNLEFMVRSIRDALRQVREVTDNLASATSQISATTEELASTSKEQSSQVNDVAAAVEQMNSTIQSNSDNANQTANKASKNGVLVQESIHKIDQMISKIKEVANFVQSTSVRLAELGKSTESITGILQVIDDIADQTNLLALNAAIEAARAGEHGRGFAVVADEVRKLAERSSKSTKEIGKIISDIQTETLNVVETMNAGNIEVKEVIKMTESSQKALSEIPSNIQEVVDLVSQIAFASEEQTSTSKQVSANVDSISGIIEESARAVSQIAEATNDLTKLAVNLQELLNMFRLSETDTHYKSNKTTGHDVRIDDFDFSAAKLAHRQWKMRLMNVILGKEKVEPQTAGNYKGCSLGKWYYGSGSFHFKNDPDFVQLENWHVNLHKLAEEIVNDVMSDKKNEAKRKLDSIDELSSKIIDLLDSLERKHQRSKTVILN
ncbi:MAG: hypothetical protein CO129_02215 [Ignavibacteriales bacterium CG_4_9_14_3_um_filter_34_10]|nr:MAG: hypothetical protein CO129_02215 [Ignavibacteriales bacterium CG_4_9_14_3_um_filter_34_10]